MYPTNMASLESPPMLDDADIVEDVSFEVLLVVVPVFRGHNSLKEAKGQQLGLSRNLLIISIKDGPEEDGEL